MTLATPSWSEGVLAAVFFRCDETEIDGKKPPAVRRIMASVFKAVRFLRMAAPSRGKA